MSDDHTSLVAKHLRRDFERHERQTLDSVKRHLDAIGVPGWAPATDDIARDWLELTDTSHNARRNKDETMDLDAYSDDELKEELRRRARPKPLDAPDWSKVIALVVKYAERRRLPIVMVDNDALAIGKAACEAVYGSDVFEQMRRWQELHDV